MSGLGSPSSWFLSKTSAQAETSPSEKASSPNGWAMGDVKTRSPGRIEAGHSQSISRSNPLDMPDTPSMQKGRSESTDSFSSLLDEMEGLLPSSGSSSSITGRDLELFRVATSRALDTVLGSKNFSARSQHSTQWEERMKKVVELEHQMQQERRSGRAEEASAMSIGVREADERVSQLHSE